MEKFILAHDLGTSGNKATLFSLDGKLGANCLYEYPTQYPGQNQVEQNPDDFWKAVCLSTRQLLEKAGISAADIAAVCFSGQMMGCLLVDAEGRILRPMIIWADTRASLQESGMEKNLEWIMYIGPRDIGSVLPIPQQNYCGYGTTNMMCIGGLIKWCMPKTISSTS
jgi:xylulokinase